MIAIYARQSVEKKDSISIESQITCCEAVLGGKEAVRYVDQGYSGKNMERPGFQKLLLDIRKGDITKIVIYRLDRMSRSLLDFAKLMELFRKYGVEFQSTQESFDTSTPMGNAMLSITMVFAQLERETIQRRIRDNYYARGGKGFYMGGRAPYGFEKIEIWVEGKRTYTLRERPDQMQWVREMYRRFGDERQSLGKVAKWLNAQKVPTPLGTQWDSSKISRTLRNPVYARANAEVYRYYQKKGCRLSNTVDEYLGDNGCYLYGRRQSSERKYTDMREHTVSLALHTGVIEPEQFLLCQHRLDDNHQIKNHGTGKKSWLSGLVQCGYCGFSMKLVESGGRYRYFRCGGKYSSHACHGGKMVHKAEKMEQVLEQELLSLLGRYQDLAVPEEFPMTRRENTAAIQLAKLEQQIDNLVEELSVGGAEIRPYIYPKLRQLDEERGRILVECQRHPENPPAKPKRFLDILTGWNGLVPEEKRELAQYFMDKVLVEENKLTIQWRYDFGQRLWEESRVRKTGT